MQKIVSSRDAIQKLTQQNCKKIDGYIDILNEELDHKGGL